MKFVLLCKRHYTNKDLITDRFGRLFHLPFQLFKLGHGGLVIAGDLHAQRKEKVTINGLSFYSLPLSLVRSYQFMQEVHKILENFKPEILLASGDSYLGFIGQKISRKYNIPFVFDVYDDYTVFGTNRIPGMKNLFYNSVKNAALVITSS